MKTEWYVPLRFYYKENHTAIVWFNNYLCIKKKVRQRAKKNKT